MVTTTTTTTTTASTTTSTTTTTIETTTTTETPTTTTVDYEVITENDIEYNVYDDHAECVGGSDELSGDVVVSDEINGVPVTKIKSFAFACKSDIESVSIPDSVTTIDNHAFVACTSLKNVVISCILNCVIKL